MKIEEGAYKKKGAAESVEQEKKDLGKMAGDEKQMDSAPARKKGGAKHIDGKEHTAKELKAEGKKLKQDARDKKKKEKKASRATKKSVRKTKKSKRLQDKIDLQTLKKSQTDDTVIKGKKSDRITNLEKRKAKADKGTDREVKADGAAKKKGAANYEDGYPPAGSGKKKGAAKYSVEKGPHPSDPPHGAHKGVGRMGFTQNFGPARQNSYARGAAKVAQIMGKGAFKKKGAADHEVGKPSHPKPNLSLNTSIKPSSSMPDYSSSSSINQEVPKAPNLTANSYKGHSSVKDVVNTQSSRRDFSSPSAMNLTDNNISRNSQFHYDTGNTSRLTPSLNASYDKFLGNSSYISSRDMKKTNKYVNMNNPVSKSNKNALNAFKEGGDYKPRY